MNQLSESGENNFETILSDINSSIYNGELTEIIEVTYAYRKIENQPNILLNKTLFKIFGGFDNFEDSDFPLSSDVLKEMELVVSEKLSSKIMLIDNFLVELSEINTENESDGLRKDFLVGALNYTKNTLELTRVGLPFEIEKAGGERKISNEEVSQRVLKLKELETELFGGDILDTPEEVDAAYNDLYTRFHNNSKDFSEDEKKEYEELVFGNLKNYTSEGFVPKISKLQENKNVSSGVNLDLKISREDYMEIFHIILNDIMHLDFEIRLEERGSIYDGEGYLAIPNSEKYETQTLKRVLELISHEIESHFTNFRTNEKLLGAFRGAGNLEKEEGLAMLIEALLGGKDINEVGYPQHFTKVMMAEALTGDDLQRFLDLQNKIQPDTGHALRLARLKRNYPLDTKGGQHKDVSYGRGIMKTIDYIKDGGNPQDLYLGKISFDDIPQAKRILESSEELGDIVKKPFLIAELIYFILDNKESGLKIHQSNFIAYLEHKYDFMDWSDIEIPVINFSIKKSVADILSIVEGSNPNRKKKAILVEEDGREFLKTV